MSKSSWIRLLRASLCLQGFLIEVVIFASFLKRKKHFSKHGLDARVSPVSGSRYAVHLNVILSRYQRVLS